MAMEIEYGKGVVVLPAKAVRVAHNAEKSDILVLLTLLSDAALCARYGQEDGVSAVAEAAGCTQDEVRSAVAFWRGAGVISISEGKKKKSVAQPKTESRAEDPAPKTAAAQEAAQKAPTQSSQALLKKSDDLPKYTTAELGDLLEQRVEIAELLTECQNLFGKIFATHEINSVLGLTDYLGLSCEYVLILATHYCAWSKDNSVRPSVRGFEKLAIAFFDREIVTVEALQEELVRQKQLQSVESKLRKLFGLGSRALSAKEKKAFSDWVHTYQYDMEMITLAFETGADASTDVSVPYVNSILARWHKEGIKTPADVQADKQASESAKTKGKAAGKGKAEQAAGSFDTDDFFDAAMRKSLGDNYDKIMKEE
jgi:DnaD/phage-associated family protein